MQPHNRFHVVRGIQGFLECASRRTSEALTLRRHIPVIFEEGIRLYISVLPALKVSFKRSGRADVRSLRSKGNKFSRRCAPIVKHALAVFSEVHKAEEVPFSIHEYFFAVSWDNRYVFTGPLVRFKNLFPVHDILRDLVGCGFALPLYGIP